MGDIEIHLGDIEIRHFVRIGRNVSLDARTKTNYRRAD